MATVTFEMNGKRYETDSDTLAVLRSIIPSAKKSNDMSAVMAVMFLGESTGRIRETVMSSEQEAAGALGFSSVEQMNNHQLWINGQKKLRGKIRERVLSSGNIVDVRDLI